MLCALVTALEKQWWPEVPSVLLPLPQGSSGALEVDRPAAHSKRRSLEVPRISTQGRTESGPRRCSIDVLVRGDMKRPRPVAAQAKPSLPDARISRAGNLLLNRLTLTGTAEGAVLYPLPSNDTSEGSWNVETGRQGMIAPFSENNNCDGRQAALAGMRCRWKQPNADQFTARRVAQSSSIHTHSPPTSWIDPPTGKAVSTNIHSTSYGLLSAMVADLSWSSYSPNACSAVCPIAAPHQRSPVRPLRQGCLAEVGGHSGKDPELGTPILIGASWVPREIPIGRDYRLGSMGKLDSSCSGCITRCEVARDLADQLSSAVHVGTYAMGCSVQLGDKSEKQSALRDGGYPALHAGPRSINNRVPGHPNGGRTSS